MPEPKAEVWNNYYYHCATEWNDPDCDSQHNDHCPVCDAEIEPYMSEDEDGNEVEHADLDKLKAEAGKLKFEDAHTVRSFCQAHGFFKVSVRWGDNPFGGEGIFWVKLTDIPKGVTLIHSSGSQTPAKTFASDKDVGERIAKLREALALTKNARCNH